jgi:hypothetical protein
MGKYTAAELRKKIKAELEELIEAEGLELEEGAGVGDMRAALLEVEESEDTDDELDDDEVDDSDEVEDDEVDDTEAPADDELDDEEDDIETDEVDDAPAAKPAKKPAAKKTKYTEGGKDADGTKLLGAKEVATQLGSDAKTLRQFFRSGKSSFEAVGAGGRYEFSEADIPKIKAEFEAWKTNKPGRGRAAGSTTSTKGKRGKSQPKAEETIDEVEEVEDLDDLDDIELND